MDIGSLEVFSSSDQVAWVGSGGKSSLLFSISQELFEKMVITTTTHLMDSQALLADRQFISEILDIQEVDNSMRMPGILLLSKGKDYLEPTKIKGYSPNELNQLSKYCRNNDVPLFIEADGARQKGIKAPSEYEPQIPDFVTKVCVVIGLGVIGKKITPDWVHRPERFAKIVGKKIGDVIDLNDLYIYSKSEEGALKCIPQNSSRILFLNQADLLSSQDEIYQFALACKENYDQVLVTNVDTDLRKVNVLAQFGYVGGVLLAAGESKRFNSPKQLALWHGISFVKTVADKLVHSPLKPVFVLVGANADLVRKELENSQVGVLYTDLWAKGQSESVKKAIETLPEFCEAVVFVLVDQPQIDLKLIETLLIKYAITKAEIIAFEFNHQIRHPVLFSRKVFHQLLAISGEAGGRQIFSQFPPLTIDMSDPEQAIDFDTVEDLNAYYRRETNKRE